MKLQDFMRNVYFPPLSRKNGAQISESIGLSDWSTRIYSEEERKAIYNKAVTIVLIKGHEDIQYEINETERDIIISYKWKDYQLPNFED